MSIPLHSFTNEQKYWYASLVIGAVLADQEIDVSETEFLKQVLSIIQSPNQKKRLMNYVASKEQPPLQAPEGLPPKALAAIFIELILIMISDLDFADHEKVFLKKVAALFKFDEHYVQQLFQWGKKGLEWKNMKEDLSDIPLPAQVPLAQLNAEQKRWYAETLISSIMSDGQIDREEVGFVKMASAMIESPAERQKLMGYMKNKMCPPLTSPPQMSREILIQIFLEVIMIVSADETVSYKEKLHLKKLAELCGFDAPQFQKMMDWCNIGIKWKQSKNQLISQCCLKKPKEEKKGPAVNEKYNSILERQVTCYVCGSEKKFKSYYLKPHTHKPDRNIFGIITYSSAFEGYDFINYNLLKVSVCPTCFFASTQKEHFRKTPKDHPPEELTNEKFIRYWLDNIKSRRLLFENNMENLNTVEPSLETVVKSYKTAIEVSNLLHKTMRNDNQKWLEISLYLNLGEIHSEHGQKEAAEDALTTALKLAENLFKNAKRCLLSIKCARILLIAALYRGDIRKANDYMGFLQEEKTQHLDHYKEEELLFLKKVYKEARQDFEQKDELKRENLIGFHLDIN